MPEPVAARQPAPAHRVDPQRAGHSAPPERARPLPPISRLQRALGNRGLDRLLRSGALQAKVAVGPPHDAFEREADRIADEVMRMPDSESGLTARRTALHVQRACSTCEQERKDEETAQRAATRLQRMCGACEEADAQEEDVAQAKRVSADPPDASPELTSYVDRSRGGGEPLPASTRTRFENRFGHDFGGVRVHTDGRSAAAAAEINSYAFTIGSDIHFGAGRFEPGTPQGDRLLAHELTHTIQQTGGRSLTSAARTSVSTSDVRPNRGAVSRTPDSQVQRFPSAGDILDSIEETVSEAADAAEGAVDAVGGAVSDAIDTAGEGLAAAGEAVGEAAEAVADTAGAVGGAVVEAGEEALDWLATEAGQLAGALAEALGVSVSITADGLEIVVPTLCPIDAITEEFELPSIDGELMVPIVAIPIGPVALTGEVGVAGHIEPVVEVQLGPICLNGLRILVNPITGSFSISGSVSATAAASLAAEVRGGLRGAVSLKGVIPIGGIPVPIDVPLAGLEGGVAGLVRGIGAGRLTIGGSLGVGAGGTISMDETHQLDFKLAADLFAGAYGQVDILGENVCRIYWQPIEWHGDLDGSIGIALGLTVSPGGAPAAVPGIAPPAFTGLPFSPIELALSREGFSDDCPIKDAICDVLEVLHLLPSQNGGVWDWAGPYGPGPLLPGPLECYQKDPAIPSGSQCRGACGPDCETCAATPIHRYVDPATGDTWEYINYQDCDSNEGCRQHDAAFDWAAAVHGETGRGAIVMPWHMAANIECTCQNLAGNCIAWIVGLPPYDRKIYFADASIMVSRGGGGGQAAGSCRADFPNAPDCIASSPDRDTVLDEWGQRSRIENFRDCGVVADDTGAGTIDCAGGPGRYWNCQATDGVSGETVTVGLFECICCNDDDTSSSIWMEPHIVVDPTTMSDELILELCDRNLIPRVICIPFEEDMIGRFGDKNRNIDLDPDKDPRSVRRPDDAPILEAFKRYYNRLDSWNIFLKTKHPDLYAEMKRTSGLDIDEHRDRWLDEIKKAGESFKEEFRNITDTDPERVRTKYNELLERIRGEIDALNRRIAAWYQAKTGTPGTIDEIIEEVHQQGTELWRAAWRRAILQVNRVLARLWPPAKRRVLLWVGQTRARHPDKDLSGTVGELDYLGSLAVGYKGPPKQNIRFNPQSFDVDGFLEAPPLSKYAVLVLGLKPKHGNIFASQTDIEPLNTFSGEAQTELVARVEGYKNDPDDPFDVAIKMEDLPEQARGKAATKRLYELREKLPPDKYREMLEELKQGGFLKPDGTALRDELTEPEADAVKTIMDTYDPAPPPVPQTPRTA